MFLPILCLAFAQLVHLQANGMKNNWQESTLRPDACDYWTRELEK